jgi:peptidoglycan/xylan/chitin deacetylase (PgdA/CDA1 family)
MLSAAVIKREVGRLLYQGGVLNLLARQQLAGRAFVLMYHRVLPEAPAAGEGVEPGMYVTADSFHQHMTYLRDSYQVLPLAELLERKERGKDLSGCCAVTFDDGWLDNFQVAFPILRALQLPATIFLPTGFIGTDRWFWPDQVMRLACAAQAGYELPADLQLVLALCGSQGPRPERLAAVLKELGPEIRTRMVAACQRLPGDGPRGRQVMNWQEVRQMAAGGLVEFGAHSVSHELLDQVAAAAAEEEICASRVRIEEELGRPCQLFSYPNGNHTPQLMSMVARQGMRWAVTTRRGYLEQRSDLLAVPRIGMHEDVSATMGLFQARILLRRF